MSPWGTPAPSQLEVILSNNVKAVWSLRENTHSPSSSVVIAGKITLAYSREGAALEGNPRSGLCAASLCAGAGREPGKAFSWRQGFGHKGHLERKEELAGLGSWLRIQYCPLLFITGNAFMYYLKDILPPGNRILQAKTQQFQSDVLKTTLFYLVINGRSESHVCQS